LKPFQGLLGGRGKISAPPRVGAADGKHHLLSKKSGRRGNRKKILFFPHSGRQEGGGVRCARSKPGQLAGNHPARSKRRTCCALTKSPATSHEDRAKTQSKSSWDFVWLGRDLSKEGTKRTKGHLMTTRTSSRLAMVRRSELGTPNQKEDQGDRISDRTN